MTLLKHQTEYTPQTGSDDTSGASWLDRFSNHQIPLAIRWSLAISGVMVSVMLLLGWYLISQQQQSFRYQTDLLGRMIVEQFAHAASEPLMADDILSLRVLVNQQKKSELIIGMQVLDLDGRQLVSEGVLPSSGKIGRLPQASGPEKLPVQPLLSWIEPGGEAITYREPIHFQNTRVGYAQVSIDRRPLERNLRSLITALITTTLGLIALGALLAVPLAHRLVRPIHQLVEVGEAIGRGEKSLQLSEQRGDEIGRVLSSFRRMAEGLDQKRHAEKALSRYLSPNVAQRVLSGAGGCELGGTRIKGSVLFCDVVGFTELSERLLPEEVADLLNDYFSYFALASNSSQGTVDKFIGDCIMILFGIPEVDEHHALHAVTCAILIQGMTEQINLRRQSEGLPIVQFRIGINSGPMLAGNLGSEEHMQYTVVGDVVNLASRICAISEPDGILLTGETFNQPGIDGLIRPVQKGTVQVRGRQMPVTTYQIDAEAIINQSLIVDTLEDIFSSRSEKAK